MRGVPANRRVCRPRRVRSGRYERRRRGCIRGAQLASEERRDAVHPRDPGRMLCIGVVIGVGVILIGIGALAIRKIVDIEV